MIEFSIPFDLFFTVSGWIVAVGLGAWRVIDAIRYRQDIKIDVHTFKDNNTEYLEVTVTNNGRRPFHIIDVGILYSNGDSYGFLSPYLETLPISSGAVATTDIKLSWKMPSYWLYKRRPYRYSLSLTTLKEDLKKQDTTVSKIYVTQETGDDKELIIPDSIKQKLNG